MDIVDQLAEMMVKEYEQKGKMADFLNVSVRFVKVCISRYKSGKTADPEPDAVAWEQILEMRKRLDPQSKWGDERREYYEKDLSLRISEQIKIAEVFLTDTNYSVNKIARLIGLSVTSVEKLKGNLQLG